MTSTVHLPGGPVLVAECDPARDGSAADLLQAIARRHAAGPPLRPGAIIDVGWAPLQLREQDAGTWQLCEPEYGAEPMDWRPGLDITLAILDSQAALARRTGAPARATRCDQWLLVAPGAMDAPAVYLERSAAEEAGHSGWYAGVNEEGASADRREATRMTAGELVLRKPSWVGVLALPAGYMAFFEHERLDSVLDRDDHEVYPPRASNDD